MAMSSYEVVRRAIEFEWPERLPLIIEALGLSDVQWVRWNQIMPWDATWEKSLTDDWGCRWARARDDNMGQVKGHPLSDWSALDHYRWLDPNDPHFYAGMEKRFAGSDGKYVLTGIFMLLFERMHTLRGFENVLTDLYLEHERVEMLADRIVEFNVGIITNISQRFPGRIHGIHFSDDWGTQQAPIINPRLWNEFFKPRYKRIFDAIHEAGWHVWMHSCGKVNALLEGLIEIGLDVANLQQPRVVGIKEIGERFRGRICFESLCDIQHTLPFKEPREIREEARLLLEHWSTPDGGFILGDYGDGEAIGVELEKKQIMLKAFLEASSLGASRKHL